MKRKKYYTLKEAIQTLNSHKYYNKDPNLFPSISISNLLKDNDIDILNSFSCNKYKNIDNIIYLFEKNGICYFKVLYTFSCVVGCCGWIEKEEIKFSLTKLRKFFTKKIYERSNN